MNTAAHSTTDKYAPTGYSKPAFYPFTPQSYEAFSISKGADRDCNYRDTLYVKVRALGQKFVERALM
jgi:hypothetical protein